MFSKSIFVFLLMVSLFFLLNLGCEKSIDVPDNNENEDQIFSSLEARKCNPSSDLPPTELVVIAVGEDNLEFWPYTGENFSGTPQDPINLIFYGKADPRDVMVIELLLDFLMNLPLMIPGPMQLEMFKPVIAQPMVGPVEQFNWPVGIMVRLVSTFGYSEWEIGQ